MAEREVDDATLRRQAADEWYNESYAFKGVGKSKAQSLWSPAYRRFMQTAAARERTKYSTSTSGGTRTLSGSATLVGSTWVNLGPTHADFLKNGSYNLAKTDGGRPQSIVVDPANASRIFVATAGGGVWRTTDGGATWTSLTESLGSLSCGALAMDPNNSNTLHLGLGDPYDGTGVGFYKTTDGGNTWTGPVYAGSSTTTQDLVVSPSDSNVVLAATDKGLFRSTDAGATWSAVSLATGQTATPKGWSIAWAGGSSFVASIEANPTVTSGTTDGQVWRTTDNGATWARATGPSATGGVGRITVASAPSSRTTLYAMAGVPNATAATDLADLYKSTNGGASWTALGVTKKRYTNANTESSTVGGLLNGQGWYNQTIVVHPTNPSMAFFGGSLLAARTSDGGTSFTQLSNWLAQFSLPYVHADFHASAFGPDGALYFGTDGGIFKSTDNGATWSDALNNGMATHLIYSVASSTLNRNVVLGGFQDNGTRIRSGTSSTFNQVIGGDGFGANINASNASNMLGSLYYTRIQKSTNGGSTWAASTSGITEAGSSSGAPFYTKIEAWAGDATGNTIYTFSNVKAYKSTNYGGTWTALGTTGLPNTQTSPLYIRNIGVAKSNGSVVGVVANSGRAFLTSNGGSSWTQVAAIPNNGLSMSYVSFDPTNPNTVYISSVAPDSTKSHLWKSTDFGASWTAIDGGGFPAGVPVDVIKVDPSTTTTLYAGTHLGAYVSTDGGATWSRFGAGMPLVEVSDLYISNDGTLVRASTYGRGFWELQ